MSSQTVTDFKARMDMREWLQTQGHRPKSRGSRAWTFPCPLHGETHGAALAVWKEGWHCFGACGTGGNIFSFVMHRDRCDFQAACKTLGIEEDTSGQSLRPKMPKSIPMRPILTPSEPPSEALQTRLRALVEEAQANLHSARGKDAFAYLRETRGLYADTIDKALLGFTNPRKDGRAWLWNDLVVPSGAILIPWFADGHLWGIKTRNPWAQRPEDRYLSVKAADERTLGKTNLAGSLYWADHLSPRTTVLIVEGEFNCLSAYQEYWDICPVSLGTSGATLNVRWYPHLLTAPKLLACFDKDKAGEQARARLGALASGVQFVQTPEGIKDINDYRVIGRDSGNGLALLDWLMDLVKGKVTA